MFVTVPPVGVGPTLAMVMLVELTIVATVTVPVPNVPVPAVAVSSSPTVKPVVLDIPVMVAVQAWPEPAIDPIVPVVEIICVVGVNNSGHDL